jgi:tRNA pseudouridine38-40 synthase
MRNIKLTIEYDGTGFCGWQIQPHHRTVIGELAKALKKLTGESPKIEYSSRTDSGVHALGQTANFHTKSKTPAAKIKKGLNSLLPCEISVIDAKDVPKDFNARFDAKAKLYKYLICDSDHPPAIYRNLIYHFRLGKLNIGKMRSAAKHLIGKHDFSAFGANDHNDLHDSPIKTITQITVAREGGIVTITVKGNGFLYKMVRRIVGTLIQAGRGRIAPGEVKIILAGKDRSKAGPTAPPHGLFLMKVYY